MNFRINSQNLFLTYAKCSIPKEDLLLALKGLCPNWKYIIVCEENHEDGQPHLHAVCQMKSRKDIINPRFFDLLTFHPKIESCKDVEASIDYVKKDNVYIEEGTPSLPAKKKKKLTNIEILAMDTVEAVEKDVISWKDAAKLEATKLLMANLKASALPIMENFILHSWDGLDLPLLQRPVKQRHYWLWSDRPNKGKTTFLQTLDEKARCSFYTTLEKYQVVRQDSQFVLFDEFAKGNSVKITVLNAICDGTFKYPVKGGKPTCPKFPTILICSNFQIHDIYPNSNGRVEARFVEIDLFNYSFKI